MASQTPYSANDQKDWRVFLIKSYGYEIPENAAKTPFLREFTRKHPNVTSAVLSYLEPGKHIPPHRGPFRGIARYHLCLKCEESDPMPYLRLEDEIFHYREGSWLFWDDTFEHEVVNHSPNWRVALLLDVKRTDTGFGLRVFGGIVMFFAVFLPVSQPGKCGNRAACSNPRTSMYRLCEFI